MLTRGRLGTFLAVVLSTALVAAALLLQASARPRIPDRFAEMSVVVRSPEAANRSDSFADSVPWPADRARGLADALSRLSGVTAVIQDRPFYAQPVGTDATTGNGWSAAAGPLVAGRPPTGDREVVVSADLGVPAGRDITILTGTGPASWRVTGLISEPTVLVADAVAARLSPGVRAIGLRGKPDPAAVKAAVKVVVGAHGTVLTGDDRGALEPRADARTRWIGSQVLAAITALAGFVCVFLVASTSAFAVGQRRRDIGLLRAVGATPRQIRSTLYRSALLTGTAAAAVGVGLGSLASLPLARLLVSGGYEPPGYAVKWVPWAVGVAFLAGPVISLLGVATAARRAARIRPLEALRIAEVEPRPMSRSRWVVGLLAAGVGVTAGLYTTAAADVSEMSQFALLAAMALVVAAAVLAPAVIPLLVRVLLAPVTGVTGTLVRESALAAVRRTASTAAPVLLTVAFGVFIVGTVETSTSAFAARRSAAVGPGAVLMPAGTPGLHDAAAPDAPLPSQVYVDGAAVPVVGAQAAPGTALVSSDAASRFGASVAVTYPDGMRATLRIAGVAPESPILADLVLARATVRTHDPSALAPAALVPRGAVAGPGTEVVSVATYARRADAEEDRLVWVFTLLLLGVSAGAGALAVANTLLMSTRDRSRDYRVLRLAGATRRQVVGTVALESVLVVVIGSVLGAGVALLALAGAARSLSAQVGEPVPIAIPWPAAAVVTATCMVLALAASALPALHLTRTARPPEPA